MSTSSTNEQPDNDLHTVLAEGDKLLKNGEKSLKLMAKMRKFLGLKSGASAEFMERIPEGEKLQEARKELEGFTRNLGTELPEQEKSNDKKGRKKRSKLAKAMSRNLRI